MQIEESFTCFLSANDSQRDKGAENSLLLTIRTWVRKANAADEPNSPEAIALSEQAELKQLRKEVRVLREERDFLKKAAAWFAQETGTPSSKRSNS